MEESGHALCVPERVCVCVCLFVCVCVPVCVCVTGVHLEFYTKLRESFVLLLSCLSPPATLCGVFFEA